LFNSGLTSVEVATRVQRVVAAAIATATSPGLALFDSQSLLLIDAAVVQMLLHQHQQHLLPLPILHLLLSALLAPSMSQLLI
jgi:hypothetical protein